MNKTSKNILSTLLYFVLFFLLVLLTQLPGYASPYYWVSFPILASFMAAGPLAMGIRKTDSVLLFPVAWFFLYRVMGEIGMDIMQIGMLGILTLTAILSVVFAKDQKKKIRVCVPTVTVMFGCNLWPLYFQTEVFKTAALGEQSAEYVQGLMNCAKIPVFLLITVLSVLTAVLSERLTETLFTKE